MRVKVAIQSRDLSKDELGDLLQSIRDCEQRLFKDKEIYISAEAPELTSDEMAEILRKIRPPFTYGPVIFKYKEEGESIGGFD